jgi:hypothetical protein
MPTASAFGHSATQSGTGAFRYQSEFPYSGTGLVPALTFFSFRYRDDQMPDSQAFRHKKNRTKGEKETLCTYTQPEYRNASTFLSVVNFFSPAAVFRYQGQSGTAGCGLVRHCPAMFLSDNNFIFKFSIWSVVRLLIIFILS